MNPETSGGASSFAGPPQTTPKDVLPPFDRGSEEELIQLCFRRCLLEGGYCVFPCNVRWRGCYLSYGTRGLNLVLPAALAGLGRLVLAMGLCPVALTGNISWTSFTSLVSTASKEKVKASTEQGLTFRCHEPHCQFRTLTLALSLPSWAGETRQQVPAGSLTVSAWTP